MDVEGHPSQQCAGEGITSWLTSSGACWMRVAWPMVVGCWRAVPPGSGTGVRITDIYRERLTVDGTAVQPDVAQPTGVQFARH
ncbi:hypothetical protein GCM10022233_42700 [Streptomyces shaanxiensis]|uniref:Uncharacterized protein n=2 Tax=Streptomyces shaanxiensis TaxID=653357 RepID=A0ABP7VC01_9ACTN